MITLGIEGTAHTLGVGIVDSDHNVMQRVDCSSGRGVSIEEAANIMPMSSPGS